jgi:hypothetical protein
MPGKNSNSNSNSISKLSTNEKLDKSEKKKFLIEFKVDPKLMSALIGTSGSNIRRITSEIRNGCYIRGNNDTFTITAYSLKAAHEAKKMLLADEAALKDPSKRPSKPFDKVSIDLSIVSHIVGKNGEGLKMIMDKVGDGCFIVHKYGRFQITANSFQDVEKAKSILLNIANQYIEYRNIEEQTKTEETNEKPNEVNKRKHKLDNNTFSILDSSDDNNISDEDNDYIIQSTPPKKVKTKNSNDDNNDLDNIDIKPKNLIDEFNKISNLSVWGDKSKTSEVINSVVNSKFIDSEQIIKSRNEEKIKKELDEQIKSIPNDKKSSVKMSWADMCDTEDEYSE